MQVYVAGQLADTATVAEVQRRVRGAGHRLTHDWLPGAGPVAPTDAPDDDPAAAAIAAADLAGVMAADAVVLVASGTEPARGLFVELGAALARADLGLLEHVVAVGPIAQDSVFWSHPRVRRVADVGEWLAGVAG